MAFSLDVGLREIMTTWITMQPCFRERNVGSLIRAKVKSLVTKHRFLASFATPRSLTLWLAKEAEVSVWLRCD